MDVRTFLILLAVADLVIAAAFWIGAGRRLKGGLSAWALGLALRAVGFGIFAVGTRPEGGALAVAAALLALSLTLQASALASFQHRPLPVWVHTAVIAAVAVPFQLLASDPATAIFFGGVVFGTLLVVSGGIASQLRAPVSAGARGMLAASFLAAGAVCYVRGLGALLTANPAEGFAMPEGFAAASLAGAYAAVLATTFGFLLLHKERAEAEALRLATIDPLTGTYNRRTFHELAEREMSRARRGGLPLSIIQVDIDHFHVVNERHGQRTGDTVLQAFAELVRSTLRKEDMIVRFGGAEFLVLLPEVPGPSAVIVAGRIRRMVANEPIEARGEKVALTVSIGVAARLDEGPESTDELLARADAALALAKQRGRNRVVALSLGRSIAA